MYEHDGGLSIRTQGHRIHIDSRGEQALHECLLPSLYELFLATRGQPSKGITVWQPGTPFTPGQGEQQAVRTN